MTGPRKQHHGTNPLRMRIPVWYGTQPRHFVFLYRGGKYIPSVQAFVGDIAALGRVVRVQLDARRHGARNVHERAAQVVFRFLDCNHHPHVSVCANAPHACHVTYCAVWTSRRPSSWSWPCPCPQPPSIVAESLVAPAWMTVSMRPVHRPARATHLARHGHGALVRVFCPRALYGECCQVSAIRGPGRELAPCTIPCTTPSPSYRPAPRACACRSPVSVCYPKPSHLKVSRRIHSAACVEDLVKKSFVVMADSRAEKQR